MFAAGSGITPMLQIIRDVLQDESDRTQLVLYYQNRNAEDILLKAVLDELRTRSPDRLLVEYFLSKPAAGWANADLHQHAGYIDVAAVKQVTEGLPSDQTKVCRFLHKPLII